MISPTDLHEPTTTRRINNLIWESLDRGGRAEPVAFFCECERHGCFRPVWLTPVEYEEGRRQPDWLALAPRHTRAVAQ